MRSANPLPDPPLLRWFLQERAAEHGHHVGRSIPFATTQNSMIPLVVSFRKADAIDRSLPVSNSVHLVLTCKMFFS
jgi:hypothetical protein